MAFLLVAMPGLVVPFGHAAAATEPATVLLINSYHKGFPWSDNVVRAVEEALAQAPRPVDLRVEYLDTKYAVDDTHLEHLYTLYRHKFRNRRFAAVIASDNAAFDFVLRYRRELFGETPVVFCGVNGFSPDMIAGQTAITGVAEVADYDGTLRLIPRLLPTVREIVIISPNAVSAAQDRKGIEAIVPALAPRVRVTFWQGVALEDAIERVARLPHGTAILSTDVIETRDGHVVPNLEKIRLIAAAAAVPVFVAREEDLGTGALGGQVISGHDQGRRAADLTLAILAGHSAEDMPVLGKGANPYMFDHAVMERFGISADALPQPSTVINAPETAYQRYRTFMVAAGLAVVVLAVFVGVLAFNIVRRQAAERALRESSERLTALIENSPTAICLKDRQGRYVLANEPLRRRYGLTVEEIIGKTADQALPPANATHAMATDAEVFATGKPLHREEVIRFADGSERFHVMTKFPIFDAQGRVNGLGFISTDITEAKRAAEAARRLQGELAHVSRLSSLGEMAAGFAHELNQPLTAIHNFASGCLRRLEQPEASPQVLLPALTAIAEQAQRAGDIIRRIRGFVGKKDEARNDQPLPAIDINAAIRAAAGLVGNDALRHDIDLRLRLAPVLPPVKADIIQIQQVVVNLARNAMEAMDEAGGPHRDLTIQTAATPEGGVEIRVLDTGPGIPEPLRARLFEPFFTTKAAGMGMGLSICRSIAEIHGGDLTVVNRSRGGAEFRLSLPPADQPELVEA